MNFSTIVQAVALGLRTVDQVAKEFADAGFAAFDREKFDAAVAEFKSQNKTYTWEAEVFAVGTWNGMKFTEEDIDQIVASFEALNGGGYLEVPLKFGHNDEQPMTDGLPALGWVKKLYKKKDDKGRTKLMASFDAVPEVVYAAVKSGRYRKVSIELEFDVTHKGKKYSHVMTAVALLGAELPAVNTLADLTAYMGRGSLVASRKACFSLAATDGKLTGEKKMAEIDDKELAELRRKAGEAEAAAAKVAQFEKDEQARKENEQKEKVKLHREKINGVLDNAVKEMRITPAQRSAFAKTLRVDDDTAVLAIATEDVEALMPEKQSDGRQAFGRAAADGKDEPVEVELDKRVREVMNNSGGKLSYSRALEMVVAEKADAAREHFNLGK